MVRAALLLGLLWGGCDGWPRGEQAPEDLHPEPSPAHAPLQPRSAPAGADRDVPPGDESAENSPRRGAVPGDPYGLLSRSQPASQPHPAGVDPAQLDPGALMATSPQARPMPPASAPAVKPATASTTPPPQSPLDRASVAPPRYRNAPIRDTTATALVNRVKGSSGKAHVLCLYGAYCPACREAMPRFLEIARAYGGRRGVHFTAASVDRDRAAFEGYLPALEGVLEPLWIRSEGKTAAELTRLGLKLGGTFSIPLVALLDRADRVVLQGNGGVLPKLPGAIESLLR